MIKTASQLETLSQAIFTSFLEKNCAIFANFLGTDIPSYCAFN